MRITQQTSRENVVGSWTRSSLQVNQKARRKVVSNHHQESGGVWLAGGRGQEELRLQRGVAEEPVSHRLWRSAGSPAPEQGPPHRGSVWPPILTWQWAPYNFQGTGAQEITWTPGGDPGCDKVVSTGFCVWCPLYTSHLNSHFHIWFEMCTVKKGNLGWRQDNQLP